MQDDDHDASMPRPYNAQSAFGPLLRFIRMSRPYGLRTVAFGNEESYRKLAERLADNGDLARQDIPTFVAELMEHVAPIHTFRGSGMYEYISTGSHHDVKVYPATVDHGKG